MCQVIVTSNIRLFHTDRKLYRLYRQTARLYIEQKTSPCSVIATPAR